MLIMVNEQSAKWTRQIGFGTSAMAFLWFLVAVHDERIPAQKPATQSSWGVLSKCRFGDSYDKVAKLCIGAGSVQTNSTPISGRTAIVVKWTKPRRVLCLEFTNKKLVAASEKIAFQNGDPGPFPRKFQKINASEPTPGFELP
jgi:hypothetical protein